jgi:hypothetical protein
MLSWLSVLLSYAMPSPCLIILLSIAGFFPSRRLAHRLLSQRLALRGGRVVGSLLSLEDFAPRPAFTCFILYDVSPDRLPCAFDRFSP